MDNKLHILNPTTNRFVLIGSPKYKRLIKEGVIKSQPQPAQTRPPSPVEILAQPKSLKKELIKTAVDIVADNKTDFVDLSQKETDKLLRRMLYEKLCLDKPSSKKHKKTHKKKKYDSSSGSDTTDSD